MLILGADTSLPLLSVALVRDAKTIGAVALEGKGSRNEKLLPAVDWLLSESGVSRSAIDLFAVTRGPGSFTGVRIGLATIQGLALALGRPVCAVSTHEAIALGSGRDAATVVDDAGRGEYYASQFVGGSETVAPHLAAEIPQGDVIRVVDFIHMNNVAACCALRADAIARSGRLDQYADITPIYVRLAEADVKRQQKG
jgi:tRNA threonylcarbamoyl adenosine modification protein YeaZ